MILFLPFLRRLPLIRFLPEDLELPVDISKWNHIQIIQWKGARTSSYGTFWEEESIKLTLAPLLPWGPLGPGGPGGPCHTWKHVTYNSSHAAFSHVAWLSKCLRCWATWRLVYLNFTHLSHDFHFLYSRNVADDPCVIYSVQNMTTVREHPAAVHECSGSCWRVRETLKQHYFLVSEWKCCILWVDTSSRDFKRHLPRAWWSCQTANLQSKQPNFPPRWLVRENNVNRCNSKATARERERKRAVLTIAPTSPFSPFSPGGPGKP